MYQIIYSCNTAYAHGTYVAYCYVECIVLFQSYKLFI